MTVLFEDETRKIERLTLGPWGTNAYLLVCNDTGESAVIDAPGEAAKLMAALRGTEPRYLLLTHNHRDHTGALVEVKQRLGIPLAAHPDDAGNLPVAPDILLQDGERFMVGKLEVQVRHTPGHTPGSICLLTGPYLFSGDTLFPGGPGKTGSPDAFRQIVASLETKIFVLPGGTKVYPGHGDDTVLEVEKEAYRKFAARKHDPGLCGDVLWDSA
ncbi:MAG: MBL fold metallo-hydrolase [Chloroflexota bacterium]